MAERKRAPRRDGGGHAWIWWLLVLALVAGGIYWAYPRYKSYLRPSRVAGGNEGYGPVRVLRLICTSNVSYQYSHPKQGYARDLADLGPRDGNYLDKKLVSGEAEGYRIEYSSRATRSGIIDQYTVNARPINGAGERSFYMDDGCEIHVTAENRAATARDPKL